MRGPAFSVFKNPTSSGAVSVDQFIVNFSHAPMRLSTYLMNGRWSAMARSHSYKQTAFRQDAIIYWQAPMASWRWNDGQCSG